ncbi:hypothetical protein HVE01_14010 [Vreelandella venusta]|nr:hypothetical protein HVE01_14010 [Halomonas venusta]
MDVSAKWVRPQPSSLSHNLRACANFSKHHRYDAKPSATSSANIATVAQDTVHVTAELTDAHHFLAATYRHVPVASKDMVVTSWWRWALIAPGLITAEKLFT